MTTVVTIKPSGPEELPRVRALYEDAFPVEERRPWPELERLIDDNPFFTLWSVMAGDRWAGFISTWKLPSVLYIEHFAILPDLRSRGVGGKALNAAKGLFPLPVLVEVEIPSDGSEGDDARRRLEFYGRSGFSVIDGIDYIQPSYAKGLPEVPMLLMSTAPVGDIVTTVIQLHNFVYNQ